MQMRLEMIEVILHQTLAVYSVLASLLNLRMQYFISDGNARGWFRGKL
jgi:hypothetical protein